MRIKTAFLASLTLIVLAACASNPAAPPPKDGDFSYLRTPLTFRSFAVKESPGNYTTTYTAPEGWTETSAKNSFVYWNAVMAVRTGNPCFTLNDVKMSRREEMGTSGLAPGEPTGPTSPGAALSTRPPKTFFEFTAVTRFETDCTKPDVINATDYLSRTPRPEQAPRKEQGK